MKEKNNINKIAKKSIPQKEDLKKYILSNLKNFERQGKKIKIDFEKLKEEPQILEWIINNPLEIKEVFEDVKELFDKDLQFVFYNLGNYKNIEDVRTEDLNKLISVKGTIKKATKIIPRTINIHYECLSCGMIIKIPQDKKEERKPSTCSCGRRTGFKETNREIMNVQEISIEELPEEVDGRQPQQLRVYLQGNLTERKINNILQPGKKIEILGIIKLLPPFMTLKDKKSNLSEFMIDALGVDSLEEEDDVTIEEEDIIHIKEIAGDKPLEKLANNLIPEVFGNEVVKKALVLQMVKGVSKLKSDGTRTRGDIHILLSGDPGVAKSVMLKAVSTKNPKARMVVGKRTSGVGLGAMVSKDELTGTWALEVGALVLANDSCLCLDEFDKMFKENQSELLEPMSAGTISISKAGINAKLPARTGILAAANPLHGSFDMLQPIAKQLDISSPILNRFDLIFIMLDTLDKEKDANSVRHIFDSYKKTREPEIDQRFFKKYISYVRKQKPVIEEDLEEDLISFYTSVRQMSRNSDANGLPINLRNIEGILRLAEANAKLRLSETVEKQDLKVAKEIFMYALKQVGLDTETGLIDTSRITQKVPTSQRGKVKRLLEELYKLSHETEMVDIDTILEKAEEIGVRKYEVYGYLNDLKRAGEIIEPKNGWFKTM